MPETSNPGKPFPDSYWVIPGKLLAGEYPYSKDELAGTRKLSHLLQSGIRAIADLTMPQDTKSYFDELVHLTDEMDIKFTYRRFAIRDMGLPEIETMISILDWIDGQLIENTPTYVHCLGGIGRTGTIIGCYLVRHGTTGQNALERITYLRKDTPDWWYVSPETWQQKEFILNWKIGE
jgi:protein-tyrosine phosphatase